MLSVDLAKSVHAHRDELVVQEQPQNGCHRRKVQYTDRHQNCTFRIDYRDRWQTEMVRGSKT